MVVEDPLLLFWSLLCWVEAMPMVLCKLACVCGPCCPRLAFPAARERARTEIRGRSQGPRLRPTTSPTDPIPRRPSDTPPTQKTRVPGRAEGPGGAYAHPLPHTARAACFCRGVQKGCKRAERAAECQYERQVLRGCVPSRSARSKACDMCAHAGDKGLQIHACTIAE